MLTQTDAMIDCLDAPTERWGAAGASGVHRTLPPPPDTRHELTRYEEGALLGSGGMGDVHACEDRRIGRTVARKTLRALRGEVEATRRFIDEARLQGRLEHPAIVPVYDLGADEAGAPFFTMKRVRGRTLAAVLASRGEAASDAWSTRRLLGALSTVALAIDYAHGHGVVHGDLKPQNVMLGRFGEVHVLDWGCATEVRGDSGEPEIGSDIIDVRALMSLCHHESSDGRVVGTPGYLAPEQAHGVRGERASDVYALGTILFEIVAGEPLHHGKTPLALLLSALTGVQRRPTQRVPGLLLAPELDDLIERTLEVDPALRPTAREVAAAIEAVLDHEASELARRRTAERHVHDAREHARRALEGGDDVARASALRDAGRAIALDPENRAAVEVLARLVVQPPTQLPPEARAELEASERTLIDLVIDGMGSRTYLWLLVAPLAIALGVRSVVGTVCTLGAILVTCGAFALAKQRGGITPRGRLGLLAISLVAVASFGGLFGPFVIVPLFATTTAAMLAFGLDLRQRWVATALGLLAIFVPVGLELIHVLPPSMTITADAIVLHPRLVWFSPTLTMWLLVIGHAVAIPVCVALTGRGWEAIDRARRKLALRTWQLELAFAHAPRRESVDPTR